MSNGNLIVVKVSVDGFLSEVAQLVYEEDDFVWKGEQLRSLVFEELEEFFNSQLEEASNLSDDEKWEACAYPHFKVERVDGSDD